VEHEALMAANTVPERVAWAVEMLDVALDDRLLEIGCGAGHAVLLICARLGATADPMPGGPEYYVFKRGEQQLCAVMQTDPAWGTFPPQWITYFGVADADGAVAAVTANGGKALSVIEPTPFGRMAALADPAGAQFKIVELPAS
jgi:predicted enzyme related to lactoylglutathione lyase